VCIEKCYNLFVSDSLDKVLRELTFKDNWRQVAMREGIWRGVFFSAVVFGILILTMYWQGVFSNAHTACYAAFA